MNKGNCFRKFMALLLSFVVAVSMIPFGAVPVSAAVQTDIPQNMWDNYVLRSLEYLGYNLEQQKADGTLYVLYGNDTIKYMPESYPFYPLDNGIGINGDNLEWVGKGNYGGGKKYTSKTGYAPWVEGFQKEGLVCAGYIAYYVFGYLPHIEGVDISRFETNYKNIYDDYNVQAVVYWYKTLELASNANNTDWSKVQKLYGASFEDLDAAPTEEQMATFRPGDIILTGGIWEEGTPKAGEKRYSHAAIYAGYYGGHHWIIEASDACPTGPHFYTFDHFMNPTQWKSISHVVGVYRLGFVPTETYEDGSIEVYKKDTNGSPLAGAQFLVTNTETNEYITLGPTDANGYAKTETLLPFGTYTVKETVFPEGYTTSGTSEWTVTINETTPQTITINAVNQLKTGKGQIIKTATNGGSVEGWKFTVTDANGNKVGDYTTDATGIIMLDLKPGTYTVTESADTYDYWRNDPTSSRTLTVTAGQTSSVTFTNQYFGRGQIIKETTNGGSKSGWKFTVTDANGTKIGDYTTGATGIITLDLNPGTYTVTETSAAPNGYWKLDATKSRTLTVTAGKTSSVTFTNQYMGVGQIIKKATNGGNVEGWEFHLWDSNWNYISKYKTDANGVISLTLNPGSYIVREVKKSDEYWKQDTSDHILTVEAGKTSSVTITNEYLGKGQIIKTATNGGSVEGWTFEVKDSSGKVVGNYTTDATGIITLDLNPGTYTVTETSSKEYWVNDSAKTLTVTAGQTSSVTFTNQYMGVGQIIKKATNGGNVEGWEFTVTDANGAEVAKTKTDANGVIVLDLNPGKYYVQETASTDPYWHCDTEKKEITVVAGQTASVSFTNQWMGKGQIIKTATNGGSVEGWAFEVKDSSGNVVGNYTTDATGIITLDLNPGEYTVTEISAAPNGYWKLDETKTRTLTVTAGQTSSVTFVNQYFGKAQIVKKATNDGNVEGWEFIVTDANGAEVAKTKTDANGVIVLDLNPGKYYVQETASSDAYWHSDTEKKEITVVAGQTAEVTVTNEWIGKAHIVKTLKNPEAGSVEGWKFSIADASGNVIGEYTTNEKGEFTVDLNPGTYTITEILEENSLWQCESQTQTITIASGATTEVQFVNALRPGKITITKVNQLNQLLADAKFLLEWSEDGVNWTPVTYSDEAVVSKGSCGTEGLTDGWLVTDETGVIVFENLYPGLQYRVTELEAPDGYVILADHAYVGELPVETLEVELTVVNSHGYDLPASGVDDAGLHTIVGTTMALLGIAFAMTFCAAKYIQVFNSRVAMNKKNKQ